MGLTGAFVVWPEEAPVPFSFGKRGGVRLCRAPNDCLCMHLARGNITIDVFTAILISTVSTTRLPSAQRNQKTPTPSLSLTSTPDSQLYSTRADPVLPAFTILTRRPSNSPPTNGLQSWPVLAQRPPRTQGWGDEPSTTRQSLGPRNVPEYHRQEAHDGLCCCELLVAR